METARQILPAIPEDEEEARGLVTEIIDKCERSIAKDTLISPIYETLWEIEDIMANTILSM